MGSTIHSMEVILLKDVAKVGRQFDIVTVADGYALNFLIPRKLAQAATPAARAAAASRKHKADADKQKYDSEIEKCVSQINGKIVTVHERANEKGHLFASLHPEKIIVALYDQLGVTVPVGCVHLSEPIKTTGDISITVGAGNTKGTLIVRVIPTE